MKDTIPQQIKCTLLSPLFLFSVSLLVVNDHILKGAGILPQIITGKLSDFAFLFFVPVIVAYLFRVKTMIGLSISYLAVGVFFSAINISAHFSRLVENLFGAAFIPIALWPDTTDLVALTTLPCSILLLLRAKTTKSIQPAKYLQFSVVFVCLLTCVATSAIQPTHEPIYMTWKEFRESAEVMPPRDIKKRGKIYIKDNYLYVNEPNKGIHIFDNSNPKKPIPKCFLNIPGNTDISIKGSYLYADSFVDLLVFALTIYPEDIVLVNRMKNVFPYDYKQISPLIESDEVNRQLKFYPTGINKSKGVVIGWRKYQGR